MRRQLTPEELAYVRPIFGTSIDYSRVRITRDHPMSIGAPKVVGCTVHLRSRWGIDQFERRASGAWSTELTEAGRRTLVHELTHVWQYQNGGLAYIPDSLMAQLKATLRHGSRSGAYVWRHAHRLQLPWARWNPEQQATLVEDYNSLVQALKSAEARGYRPLPDDTELVRTARPYLDELERRQGAPTWRMVHGAAALTGAALGALAAWPLGSIAAAAAALVGALLGLFAGAFLRARI